MRLDIGWADLLWGLRAAGNGDGEPAEADLVCLSVRSGFDLLLSARGPSGRPQRLDQSSVGAIGQLGIAGRVGEDAIIRFRDR